MNESMNWLGAPPDELNTPATMPAAGGPFKAGPLLPDLLNGFLAEVKSYLPKIQRALEEFHQQPQQTEFLQEAHRHVRTLKGAAAVVGLTPLSDIAISFEEVLERLTANSTPLTQEQLFTLNHLVAQLDFYLEQVTAGNQSIPLSLTEALRAVRFLLPAPSPSQSKGAAFYSPSRQAPLQDLSAWLDMVDDEPMPPVTLGGEPSPLPPPPPVVPEPPAPTFTAPPPPAAKNSSPVSNLPASVPPPVSVSPSVRRQGQTVELPRLVENIPPELLEVFLPEAEEHLRVMTLSLPALAAQPQNKPLLQEIRRSAHSLKGSAAVVGFKEITKLAHRAEDLLDLLYEDEIKLLPEHLQLLFASTEVLENLLNQRPDVLRLRQLYETYDELLSQAPAAPPSHNLDHEPDPDPDHHHDYDKVLQPELAKRTTKPLLSDSPKEVFEPTAEIHAQPGAEPDPVATPLFTRGKDVRVPIERLDAVVKLVTELLVNQASFEQNMKRLHRQLEEVHANSSRLSRVASKMEVQFEVSTLGGRQPAMTAGLAGIGSKGYNSGYSNGYANGSGSPASAPAATLLSQNTYGFDALEFDRYTEFHLLLRELTEAASDVQTLESELNEVREYFESSLNRQARLCSDIQEQLMRLRMVPLSTLSTRLHRTAHNVATQRDKLVHFSIEGEETRLDKTVIEEMADPLLHILRNAIDHGIEPPALREAQGKPAHGSIRLRAFHEGTQTVIQIGDDGGGLDPERLRQKAIQNGLISSTAAVKLSEQELYSMIFLPGFSTAAEISEISGRGVGLDVVKSTVHRLKGSVYVDSHPGAGTVFTMRLPMTLAVMRALMVKCGGQTFAVPVVGLSQVVKLTPDVLERLGHDDIVRTGGKVYPLLQLNRLLNLPPAPPSGNPQLALLLTVEDRQVAIAVDETMGGREIVVKNLGNHLRRVHGATGATLLGDGRVVLILNLPELVRDVFRPRPQAFDARKEPRTVSSATSRPLPQLPAAKVPRPANAALTVLVVDDSLSVRRVLSNRLMAAGWTPLQAKDGLDALEQLQQMQAPPDLMLVDIEMPRMDGYEFISTLRKQPEYAHLPVIVLTSRAGQKHRDRAFEVGATEYLVKPYQDDVLLSLVRRLAQHR